jgi:hypothetical protein
MRADGANGCLPVTQSVMSNDDDGCMFGSAAEASDDDRGEERSVDVNHSPSQVQLTRRDDKQDSNLEQEEHELGFGADAIQDCPSDDGLDLDTVHIDSQAAES